MSTLSAMHTPANPLFAYIEAFVDEFPRMGLFHVVVCPGSRSTPLALALAARTDIKVWMHVDERSAAFFALGIAKRSGQPVALLCTSGTAAANFYPAIVEANLTHVPLLVLTADRPPELRDCGAPQAIDQNRLYGQHVKWFADVALPEASDAALGYIRSIADRAIATAREIPAGPVHLNMPFREPLVPVSQPLPDARNNAAWYGRPNAAPYTHVGSLQLAPPLPHDIADIIARCRTAPHGLIIVGPQEDAALVDSVQQVATLLGYPILADPLSQFRSIGKGEQPNIITSYDAFLRIEACVERAEPQIIIRFGAMPTAKPVLQLIQRFPDCPVIVIDGSVDWDEPTHTAAQLIHASPTDCCHQMIAKLQEQPLSTIDVNWIAWWQQTEAVTRQALANAIHEMSEPFEGRVYQELATLLPADTALCIGNSMPVRDLDTFMGQTDQPLTIYGNRGANGIDGIISTAAGISAIQGDRPTLLVIGDLSFYHDMNGLLATKLHHLNVTIIVINNDGGGIFSFLSQAAYPDHFEQLFGTPLGLDYSLAVQMYGGVFQDVADWNDLGQSVQTGLNTGGLQVIQVRTDRQQNVIQHRQLWQVVERELDQAQLLSLSTKLPAEAR